MCCCEQLVTTDSGEHRAPTRNRKYGSVHERVSRPSQPDLPDDAGRRVAECVKFVTKINDPVIDELQMVNHCFLPFALDAIRRGGEAHRYRDRQGQPVAAGYRRRQRQNGTRVAPAREADDTRRLCQCVPESAIKRRVEPAGLRLRDVSGTVGQTAQQVGHHLKGSWDWYVDCDLCRAVHRDRLLAMSVTVKHGLHVIELGVIAAGCHQIRVRS